MANIIHLALKDLLQILRDKKVFMFMLLMPIAFTLLFGFAFGGGGSKNNDERLPIGYLDLDHGRFSPELVSLLNGSEVFRLVVDAKADRAALERSVAQEKLAAALIVPEGYSQSLLSGQPASLVLVADLSSQAGLAAQSAIQPAVGILLSSVRAANLVEQGVGKRASQALFDQTIVNAMDAWKVPPVALKITKAEAPAEKGESESILSYAQTAPGMMLQFAIAGLLANAQVLVSERKSRTLQRLLTTSVSRVHVLLGHFLAIFAITLAQFLLLIAFGQLFLKLDYLRQPLATLLLALSAALCIAALGLLIGVIAKNDDQAVILSLVPMFAFAGLGGAWVPLEYTGKAFQTIGHLTPVAWAMDGFKNILARGLDLSSVWLPTAALLGYTLLFFALAAWRFRNE